ncbi:hypothetical protein WJX72_005533 [[Myrmecia] bisecta]|uniref:F-box domain-containing protein n=1 Tax=[Myrmecia] bisecta TaxID=41462 RepID=A0AAW1P2K2_9CHLO
MAVVTRSQARANARHRTRTHAASLKSDQHKRVVRAKTWKAPVRTVKHDPAQLLGPDLLGAIFSHLEAETLRNCVEVSRQWHAVAKQDYLWRPLCEDLWNGKVFVPQRQQASSASFKQRYLASTTAATKASLTAEELCAFTWNFRFKRTAGAYCMSYDPFWTKTGPMMQRHFHADRSVTGSPRTHPFWMPEYECTWRFTKYREGKAGHYVKVNYWPALGISRTPGWGWRMENCWVVYEADLQLGGPLANGLPAPAPAAVSATAVASAVGSALEGGAASAAVAGTSA